MRKFELLATSVSGIGNKIFRYPATDLKETDFPEGNADELVKQGYLKEIKGGKKAESSEQDELLHKFENTEIALIGKTFNYGELKKIAKLKGLPKEVKKQTDIISELTKLRA